MRVGVPTSIKQSVGMVDLRGMKGFVYILRDLSNNRFYVGSTCNIKRRIYHHKHGHTYTTRKMAKIELAFSQEFKSIDLARKVEAKLKKLKRKDYIEKIVSDGFIKMPGT